MQKRFVRAMTPAMTIATWALPVLLGVLGLVFGSFIATLAIRWPQGRGIANGRSACDGCGTPLRPLELVPVLSFLAQRGRCRTCNAQIAPSHILAELAGLAIGVAAALVAPPDSAIAGAIFGWLLLTLATLDLAAFWLPDMLTAALALSGLAAGLFGLEPVLIERLIGGFTGFGALWLVASLYRVARGRQGLGGGDPKMFGAIGLWLGWQALPLVLLAACLIGFAAIAAMMLVGRRPGLADRLPFGVMLAAAGFVVWLGARM